jgi:hypothetical protein
VVEAKGEFAIEISRLAGGTNKCKGTFEARHLPVTKGSKWQYGACDSKCHSVPAE